MGDEGRVLKGHFDDEGCVNEKVVCGCVHMYAGPCASVEEMLSHPPVEDACCLTQSHLTVLC